MRLMTIVLIATAFTLPGCQSQPSSHEQSSAATEGVSPQPAAATEGVSPQPAAATQPAATTQPATAATLSGPQQAELACGMCVFKLEGLTSCQTAVRVGGKIYALAADEGITIPQHLCSGEVEATIEGHVDGETFVANSIIVDDEALKAGAM